MPKCIGGFDWDDGNRDKCAKHSVSHAEIEALFRQRPAVYPDIAHSHSETRFHAIGRVNERYIFAVFTLRKINGQTLIRPISARYMHDKEVKHYEQIKNA